MQISACVWEIVDENEAAADRIKIHRIEQPGDHDIYEIRQHGWCLNKDDLFEADPTPLPRDESFKRRCWYDTFDSAAKAIEGL